MRCLYPQSKSTFFNGAEYQFKHACGQCRACRVRRSQEWVTRLMMESYSHSESVFTTLTYAEDRVSVAKRDLQKFLKRLRSRLAPDRFRYFAVGEYGERTGRPHYHIMLFGVGVGQESNIEEAWRNGFIKVDELNRARCRYIVKYTIKRLTQPDAFSDGRSPEFALMSRKPSLGRAMLQSAMECARRSGIYIDTGHSARKSERVMLSTLPGCIRLDGRIHPLDRNFKLLLQEGLGAPMRNSLKKAVIRSVQPMEPAIVGMQEAEKTQNELVSVSRKRGSL